MYQIPIAIALLASAAHAQTITRENATFEASNASQIGDSATINGITNLSADGTTVRFESPSNWRFGASISLRDRVRFTFQTDGSSDSTIMLRGFDGLEFSFDLLSNGKLRFGGTTYDFETLSGDPFVRVNVEEDGDIQFRDWEGKVLRDATERVVTVRRDQLTQSTTTSSDLVSVSQSGLKVIRGGVDFIGDDTAIIFPCNAADLDGDGDNDLTDSFLFLDNYDPSGC